MTTRRSKTLSENHKRGISSTLALLDEMLCRFERWSKGEQAEGVLYLERNMLTAQQRRILAEVGAVRVPLAELRESLGLAVKTQAVGRAIRSESSAYWEALVELGTKYLRRYGEMPDGFGEYFDPKVEQIIGHMTRIAAAAAGSKGPDSRGNRR